MHSLLDCLLVCVGQILFFVVSILLLYNQRKRFVWFLLLHNQRKGTDLEKKCVHCIYCDLLRFGCCCGCIIFSCSMQFWTSLLLLLFFTFSEVVCMNSKVKRNSIEDVQVFLLHNYQYLQRCISHKDVFAPKNVQVFLLYIRHKDVKVLLLYNSPQIEIIYSLQIYTLLLLFIQLR